MNLSAVIRFLSAYLPAYRKNVTVEILKMILKYNQDLEQNNNLLHEFQGLYLKAEIRISKTHDKNMTN